MLVKTLEILGGWFLVALIVSPIIGKMLHRMSESYPPVVEKNE